MFVRHIWALRRWEFTAKHGGQHAEVWRLAPRLVPHKKQREGLLKSVSSRFSSDWLRRLVREMANFLLTKEIQVWKFLETGKGHEKITILLVGENGYIPYHHHELLKLWSVYFCEKNSLTQIEMGRSCWMVNSQWIQGSVFFILILCILHPSQT